MLRSIFTRRDIPFDFVSTSSMVGSSSRSTANKNGKRYRYYITHSKHQTADCPALRLPAHDLESLVRQNLADALNDGSQIANAAAAHDLEAGAVAPLIADAASDGKVLAICETNARSLIVKWVTRIDLSEESATITIKLGDEIEFRIAFAMAKHRRGADVKLIVNTTQSRPRDEQLCLLMADAHLAKARMLADTHLDLNQLAQSAGVGTARFKKLLRLSFLAPDIVESVLDGRQPSSMTAPMLNTIANLPIEWASQRALLGAA